MREEFYCIDRCITISLKNHKRFNTAVSIFLVYSYLWFRISPVYTYKYVDTEIYPDSNNIFHNSKL